MRSFPLPREASLAVAVLLLSMSCRCGSRELIGRRDASSDSGSEGGRVVPGCTVLGAHCSGVPCQCEDCIDNDGDGFVDFGRDPECTTFSDNDEATFALDLPGDNRDCREDCYFDGNSGGGGMDCQVPVACSVDVVAFDARFAKNCTALVPDAGVTNDCVIQTSCHDSCLQYVPNGCDCFGCCAIVGVDGVTYEVLVGSACTRADLNGGYGNCFPCTQNSTCINPCGSCEVCAGRTYADLPSSCFDADGGLINGCDAPLTACASNADCGTGYACAAGCCLLAP